jgi:predicted butyrate kinase (DUF1464 family)
MNIVISCGPKTGVNVGERAAEVFSFDDGANKIIMRPATDKAPPAANAIVEIEALDAALRSMEALASSGHVLPAQPAAVASL